VIAVTAGCVVCGARFTRHVLTAHEAAVVAQRGQCDGCYARQEQAARDWIDEGGEA